MILVIVYQSSQQPLMTNKQGICIHCSNKTQPTGKVPASGMNSQLSYGFCCPNISTCIFNKCLWRRTTAGAATTHRRPVGGSSFAWKSFEVELAAAEAEAFDKFDFNSRFSSGFRFRFRLGGRHKEHASFGLGQERAKVVWKLEDKQQWHALIWPGTGTWPGQLTTLDLWLARRWPRAQERRSWQDRTISREKSIREVRLKWSRSVECLTKCMNK